MKFLKKKIQTEIEFKIKNSKFKKTLEVNLINRFKWKITNLEDKVKRSGSLRQFGIQ